MLGPTKGQHRGNIQGRGMGVKEEEEEGGKNEEKWPSWRQGQRSKDVVPISDLKAVKGVETEK